MVPASPKVLLVTGDPEVRSELADRLAREGALVALAGSGAEALATDLGRFELVILDLELPDMDGLAALSALRSAGAVTAPVFLLRGEGEPAHVLQRGLDFGASGYIIKHRMPRDPAALAVVADLTLGNGRRDACPFSSRREFGRCTVFMPLALTAAEGDGEPSVTCSHLRVGTSDTWRLYPRCAIGDQAARDRYEAERSPA